MKKAVLISLLFIPFTLFPQSKNVSEKILMVLSSYGKDMGETRPGYEFDEFSQAYLVFKNNNLLIDIASPKGGKVESDNFNMEKLYNQIVMKDEEAMKLLDNTKSTAEVNPLDYDAVYIVGGKGAMFDLPFDPSLQDIILNLYNRSETVISSVCHGPASFVNVKNNDDYIIKDVELTSFCNIEEDLFGKKWVKEFPFKLEDKLKSRGAIFKQTDFMLSKVSVSGKFVTGQNPFSTTKSAEAVVKALGIEPVTRELYADERTVYLLQEILDEKKNSQSVANELEANKAKYDVPLMAIYGYYKMLASEENHIELKKGIQIVELTSPHFYNENLQFTLAKMYVTIDNKDKAKAVLDELIAKGLLMEQAEKLLKEIS